MQRLTLPGTGRSTTRLGFGCSTLMGRMNRRESLAVLEAAWDAGIRHFDVAPLYGWGAAESCLGEFLRRHQGEATITTKFGILPPPKNSWTGLARQAARPVLGVFPGLKKRVLRAAGAAVGAPARAPLTAAEARASLERSRAALQTDRIDLLLMHDASAARLSDPALLDFLREAVAAGTIGAFGVSHDPAEIPALRDQRPDYCRVLQFEWSVRQPVPNFPGSFRIHHRSLSNSFAAISAALDQRADLRRQWSDELGCDLSSPAILAALMLKAALVMNPESILLVSSKNPAHIAANVRTAGDAALAEAARLFYERVQSSGIAAQPAAVPASV